MKKILITVFLTALVVTAMPVLAQDRNNPGGSDQNIKVDNIPNPIKCGKSDCNLFDFIEIIVDKVLLPIGGVVAVMAFIYSGFLFVTAQGSEDKIKTAKTSLWYTAIGTAILLGAKVLTTVIQNTVGSLSP